MSAHTNIDSLVSSIAGYPINYPRDISIAIVELNDLFQRLHNSTQSSLNDPSRGTFIKEIAHFAHSIYSHVLVLTQHLNQQQHQNYEYLFNSASEAQQALTKILRLSFNEDYRNAEISLGLVNATCQLLVLDVAVFGLKKEKMIQETRRIIGNTLTNLTFGNVKVKLKICGHEGFLDTVTQLIDNKDDLLQAYAALIRNLSWNSDNRMAFALAKVVPALTRAATVRLQDLHQEIFMRKDTHDENKSLLSVLSALWNLASQSAENNKRAICETQAFLYLLIINLTNNPDKTLFVENATGILKYVSSYIAENEHLLKIVHEAKIVKHLLLLLSSSSFTVILNTLGVFGTLASRDQRTQLKLVQSEQAVILESLRNSMRDDVRNAVKVVLTHLNSSPLSGFAMTLPSTSRLNSGRKDMRTSHDSNVMPHLMSTQPLLPYRQVSQSILSPDAPPNFSTIKPPSSVPANPYSTFPYSKQNRANFSQPKTNVFDFGDDLTESQVGTCNGSLQSLTNDVPTNWQSNITTTRNSGNHSPISPSNLPDSPSNFFLDNDQDVDQQQLDEESCILNEAIEAAMPKPRHIHSPPGNLLTKFDSIDDGTEILSNAIDSVMPKPRRRDHLNLKPTNNHSKQTNVLEQSALLINENTSEKVRDASKLEQTKSEDNFCVTDMNNDATDSMIPQDVDADFQAEQMIIDCLSVTTNVQKPRAVAKPNQMDRQTDTNEAKKPNRSARISPFNYKQPVQNPSSVNEKSDKYAKNSSRKASITVANL